MPQDIMISGEQELPPEVFNCSMPMERPCRVIYRETSIRLTKGLLLLN